MQPKIFSFDVFDTCITRRFAYPRDLFFELGMRLAPANLSPEQAEVFARKFQALRIRAEKWASRRNWPHRSPDIYEIYRGFRPPKGCTKNSDQILEAEIALEAESIYAIPKAIEKIAQARQAGGKVIFISDMYLPADVLAPMLKKIGVMVSGDSLYVSCDVKRSKRSGELFKHVIAAEAVQPEQISHIGDNFHADVLMGIKAGISASHFPDALLTEYERRITGGKVSRHAGALHTAALSRRSRLNFVISDEASQRALDPLIHSTIAPFLVNYVSWVLDQARRAGIKRLYFVARDGQIFYKIALQLLGEDTDLELRYLYGSRSAWFTASITSGATAAERFLAPKGQPNSRSDILSRAGIAADTQLFVLNRLSIAEGDRSKNLHPEQAKLFVQRVLADRETSNLVFESASKARNVVLKYFYQEGLLDGTPWGLVDVGWSLNSQAALKRIISTVKGDNFPIIGYYIGISKDHLAPEDVGIAQSYLPGVGSLLTRRRVIIEQCFTPATHATTSGYAIEGETVIPVFGAESRGRTELEYAARLQIISEHYARFILEDQPARKKFLSNKKMAIKIAENFVENPTISDANYLSVFGTIADMRHERSYIQPLCGPMSFRDVLAMIATTSLPGRGFNNRGFIWLEGSKALSPFYIRAPITLILWLDSVRNRLRN